MLVCALGSTQGLQVHAEPSKFRGMNYMLTPVRYFWDAQTFFFFRVQYFSPRAAVLARSKISRADHESGLRIDQRSVADDENWILTLRSRVDVVLEPIMATICESWSESLAMRALRTTSWSTGR